MTSSDGKGNKNPTVAAPTKKAGEITNTGEHTSIAQFTGLEGQKDQRLVAMVQITTGGENGKILAIDEEKGLSMGRAKECDLPVNDPSCSRRHAEIFFGPGGLYYFKDLGSTNGSQINGEKVAKVPVQLNDGDRIQIGDSSVLRFSLVPESDAQTQMDVYYRATRDLLTNAFNRRHFEENLNRELSFHNRGGQGIGLIIFDVDFFKKVNDTYGHAAGDEVLREIGRRMAQLTRKEDLFARIGGEEFAVIVRSDNPEGASLFAERIRAKMESAPIEHGGKQLAFTVSLGVCVLKGTPATPLTAEQVSEAADSALYEAKRSGRNRVVSKSL